MLVCNFLKNVIIKNKIIIIEKITKNKKKIEKFVVIVWKDIDFSLNIYVLNKFKEFFKSFYIVSV